MPVANKNIVSASDYLIMERASTEKHEFYRGEVSAISGAGIQHNIIFSNTFGILSNQLKGKNCRPFGSDLRIHIPLNSLYTYPDISVVCGKIETTDNTFDTIINPSIIIEILSATTRDYDKGGKFALYRDITSLKEYIIIDSEQVAVEKFIRNMDGSWQLTEFKQLTESFTIETVAISLLLKDLYEGVVN